MAYSSKYTYAKNRQWKLNDYLPSDENITELGRIFKKQMLETHLHYGRYKLQNLYCECIVNIFNTHCEIHNNILAISKRTHLIITILLCKCIDQILDRLLNKVSTILLYKSDSDLCDILEKNLFMEPVFGANTDWLTSHKTTAFKNLVLSIEMKNCASINSLREETVDSIWICCLYKVLLEIFRETDYGKEIIANEIKSVIETVEPKSTSLGLEQQKEIDYADIDQIKKEDDAYDIEIEGNYIKSLSPIEPFQNDINNDEEPMEVEYEMVINDIFADQEVKIEQPIIQDDNIEIYKSPKSLVKSKHAIYYVEHRQFQPILDLNCSPNGDEIILEINLSNKPSDVCLSNILSLEVFALEGADIIYNGFAMNLNNWSRLHLKNVNMFTEFPIIIRLQEFPKLIRLHFIVRFLLYDKGIKYRGPMSNIVSYMLSDD